ncbi:MAG: alpha/beta fold hydrolase [Solirubrobacterales bacterium]
MNEAISAGRVSRLDVEIYYEVFGEGPPVVLVAGLGDDRLSWQLQVEEFSLDHQVIVFDNRGIGRSTIAPGPYDVRDMAEDCHAVVGALGLSGVTAVGSSMGGAICQWWALEHPEDIGRLVLTNTWARRDVFLEALFTHWIRLVEHGDQQAILESLLLFCFSSEFLEANPQVRPEFYKAGLPNLQGFIAGAHACRSHHALDRLGEIKQPTLVIGGEHDLLTRPAFSEDLAEQIAAAELALLSSGHMVFWERVEEFNDLVGEFLH